MSTATLERDAKALGEALKSSAGTVAVPLSRESAEVAFRALKAEAEGREVIVSDTRGEVTPSEAAVMLGMSRPQVRRVMERGGLPYRMVGSHHRIKAEDVRRYDQESRSRKVAALQAMAELENQAGIED
ncbi:MAG: helix-turn-helix domain-containing protein [Propionibacteriaceae bacterium]|jgi:excisionase family DNA binding protein|nr:helix-turn-helix domain-containing protein [Propionibacteriaceae bacterium]